MESIHNANIKDYGVTGVSRSGRVRKRSSKLMDFQSPDEVDKKGRRSTAKQIIRSTGRGRSGASNVRTRRNIRKIDERSAVVEDGIEATIGNDMGLDNALNDALIQVAQHSANALNLDGDSDDDVLGELVADLVAAETSILQNTNPTNLNSNVRKSIYMSENKRKEGRLERKDKGKSRFTAYNVWAREFRKTPKYGKKQDSDVNGSMKRLSELWSNVSNKEKRDWKRKAKLQATKAKTRGKSFQTTTTTSPTTTTTTTTTSTSTTTIAAATTTTTTGTTTPANDKNQQTTSFINRATTSRTRKLAEDKQKSDNTTNVGSRKTANVAAATSTNAKHQRRTPRKTQISNTKATNLPLRTTPTTATTTTAIDSNPGTLHNIEAVDVAAHLKLLGESLSVIGDRLKEHEGQIAFSGSLSVLLDSLLCSLGPLLCLATSLPAFEENAKLKTSLSSTLDNIAYIMPGL